MAHFEPFPLEICTRICAFIHSGGINPAFTPEDADKTLTQISTASWTWNFASRSIQFEEVHVSTTNDLAKFIARMSSPNGVATHIRQLVIGSLFHSNPVKLSTWPSEYFDLRILEVLLPHLQSLKIGNLTPLRSSDITTFRSLDVSPLPLSSRLTGLKVCATFFNGASQASQFLGTLPNIQELVFFRVTPNFVKTLPTYLPHSVRSLRLEEYGRWHLDSNYVQSQPFTSLVAAPMSLDRFYYKNLSFRAAKILDKILLAFADRASVTIILYKRHCATFDLAAFHRRMIEVAHMVQIFRPRPGSGLFIPRSLPKLALVEPE